jgi:hypothetical protein
VIFERFFAALSFCSKIHGHSDPASGCQNLPQKYKFPKHIGTFENACVREKNQKIVGLFNDFQWFCSRGLFWKNENVFLKVRPESLRSRWPEAIARSAPSAFGVVLRTACLRRFFISSLADPSPSSFYTPPLFLYTLPLFSLLFIPSPSSFYPLPLFSLLFTPFSIFALLITSPIPLLFVSLPFPSSLFFLLFSEDASRLQSLEAG